MQADKLPFLLSTLIRRDPSSNVRSLLHSYNLWRQAFFDSIAQVSSHRGPRQSPCTVYSHSFANFILSQHVTPDRVRALESPEIPIPYTESDLCRTGSCLYAPSPPALQARQACAPGTQEPSTRRHGRRRTVE
jgi:hypothetical protein